MTNVPTGHLMHADLTPTWLDHVAVQRCLAGHAIGRALHHAERLAVARAAHARGDSAAELGRLLGCTGDTVSNYIREATCSD